MHPPLYQVANVVSIQDLSGLSRVLRAVKPLRRVPASIPQHRITPGVLAQVRRNVVNLFRGTKNIEKKKENSADMWGKGTTKRWKFCKGSARKTYRKFTIDGVLEHHQTRTISDISITGQQTTRAEKEPHVYVKAVASTVRLKFSDHLKG